MSTHYEQRILDTCTELDRGQRITDVKASLPPPPTTTQYRGGPPPPAPVAKPPSPPAPVPVAQASRPPPPPQLLEVAAPLSDETIKLHLELAGARAALDTLRAEHGERMAKLQTEMAGEKLAALAAADASAQAAKRAEAERDAAISAQGAAAARVRTLETENAVMFGTRQAAEEAARQAKAQLAAYDDEIKKGNLVPYGMTTGAPADAAKYIAELEGKYADLQAKSVNALRLVLEQGEARARDEVVALGKVERRHAAELLARDETAAKLREQLEAAANGREDEIKRRLSGAVAAYEGAAKERTEYLDRANRAEARAKELELGATKAAAEIAALRAENSTQGQLIAALQGSLDVAKEMKAAAEEEAGGSSGKSLGGAGGDSGEVAAADEGPADDPAGVSMAYTYSDLSDRLDIIAFNTDRSLVETADAVHDRARDNVQTMSNTGLIKLELTGDRWTVFMDGKPLADPKDAAEIVAHPWAMTGGVVAVHTWWRHRWYKETGDARIWAAARVLPMGRDLLVAQDASGIVVAKRVEEVLPDGTVDYHPGVHVQDFSEPFASRVTLYALYSGDGKTTDLYAYTGDMFNVEGTKVETAVELCTAIYGHPLPPPDAPSASAAAAATTTPEQSLHETTIGGLQFMSLRRFGDRADIVRAMSTGPGVKIDILVRRVDTGDLRAAAETARARMAALNSQPAESRATRPGVTVVIADGDRTHVSRYRHKQHTVATTKKTGKAWEWATSDEGGDLPAWWWRIPYKARGTASWSMTRPGKEFTKDLSTAEAARVKTFFDVAEAAKPYPLGQRHIAVCSGDILCVALLSIVPPGKTGPAAQLYIGGVDDIVVYRILEGYEVTILAAVGDRSSESPTGYDYWIALQTVDTRAEASKTWMVNRCEQISYLFAVCRMIDDEEILRSVHSPQ